jgi:DNA sulfur modification protein DndC
MWRTEEGDWEDAVPEIYRAVTGDDLDWVEEDTTGSRALDRRILEEVCIEHEVKAPLLRELIDLERDLQGLGRRASVHERIDRILSKDWRSAAEVFEEIGWRADADADDIDEEIDAN